ncbi:MAG: isoaspartyl peptidase/L-asparaginase [Pseudomonadota bacterium]
MLRIITALVAGLTLATVAHAQGPTAIVIHGGAGTILRQNLTAEVEAAYRSKLSEAAKAGYEVLTGGGSSRDAVIAAITIMEDSALFNAGHGAVFTHAGRVELDASIMDGSDLNAGAIASVTRVRNPIRLAERVLTDSPHVMLVGEGAEVFAAAQNLELVDNAYFHTERRRSALQRAIEQEREALSEDASDTPILVDDKRGTVGAVALDQEGNISAGTSTGGMTNKRFGRVGDSPIIGAGTYADNRACGISATGHGEYFIRAAVAHDICARVLYKGVDLQTAADEVVLDRLVAMGADGGVIGLAPDGSVVYSFNSAGMYRAAIDASGTLSTGIYAKE